jgi:hypothetical protein
MEWDVMCDQSFPERIFVWPGRPPVGWMDADGEKLREGEAEYIRADTGSFYQEKDIDALQSRVDAAEDERDRLRERIDAAGEALVAAYHNPEGTLWNHGTTPTPRDRAKWEGVRETAQDVLSVLDPDRARAALQGEGEG